MITNQDFRVSLMTANMAEVYHYADIAIPAMEGHFFRSKCGVLIPSRWVCSYPNTVNASDQMCPDCARVVVGERIPGQITWP
jgi:hypothetical protein